MSRKRPLDDLGAAPPEQEAPRSPWKRLRPTVGIVMWLEKKRRRASAATVGQMAHMVRQAQLDKAKLLVFLMVLLARLGSMESLLLDLPNMLQSLLAEQFAALHRSMMVSLQDMIRSTVQTQMQARQAASLPNVISQPLRQISEDFPETRGITRVKLRFVGVDRPEDTLFTGCPVQWKNGGEAKVVIFENDRQIMQGDHSKLQIEILPVYADFFTEQGREEFTKEELDKQIYLYKGKESVLKTVTLTNGEAYIGSFSFTESSQRKMLRLTARVKRQCLTTIRVQEAITDPFVVKDRRSISNEKSSLPSKEDAIHQLKEICPKGKRWRKLADNNITKVKHLLRHYHKDEVGLQELAGMKNKDWKTMIDHATTCVPGDEIYSYWVQVDNCEILFNDFFVLVGKMTDHYVPYSVNDTNNFPQRKVNIWKQSAYKQFDERESSGRLTPDYFMDNGHPVRAVPLNYDAGPSVQEIGDQRPLNGFPQDAVLSNKEAGPSNQETLPFSQPTHGQTLHQGSGQYDPSMTQNGTRGYPPQGNVLNDQGSFSAQITIPPHIAVPDDTITGASIPCQGTSSLNHVPANISSVSPSVQARETWQCPNGMAARDEFGDRHPLNGFSRAEFLSNNDAGPSHQETLLFPQHMYQGLGQHDPSMSQNGTPYNLPQGITLNGQGQFSTQPTIPLHYFKPPPQDDMVIGASITDQGASSLNHVLDATSIGSPSFGIENFLHLVAYDGDQGIAPTNDAYSNNQSHGYEHDGGNQ